MILNQADFLKKLAALLLTEGENKIRRADVKTLVSKMESNALTMIEEQDITQEIKAELVGMLSFFEDVTARLDQKTTPYLSKDEVKVEISYLIPCLRQAPRLFSEAGEQERELVRQLEGRLLELEQLLIAPTAPVVASSSVAPAIVAPVVASADGGKQALYKRERHAQAAKVNNLLAWMLSYVDPRVPAWLTVAKVASPTSISIRFSLRTDEAASIISSDKAALNAWYRRVVAYLKLIPDMPPFLCSPLDALSTAYLLSLTKAHLRVLKNLFQGTGRPEFPIGSVDYIESTCPVSRLVSSESIARDDIKGPLSLAFDLMNLSLSSVKGWYHQEGSLFLAIDPKVIPAKAEGSLFSAGEAVKNPPRGLSALFSKREERVTGILLSEERCCEIINTHMKVNIVEHMTSDFKSAQYIADQLLLRRIAPLTEIARLEKPKPIGPVASPSLRK